MYEREKLITASLFNYTGFVRHLHKIIRFSNICLKIGV